MSDPETSAAESTKALDLKALQASFDAALDATYASRFEILPAPFEGHRVLAIGAAVRAGIHNADGDKETLEEVRIKGAFFISERFAQRLIEKLTKEFELSGPKAANSEK